MPKRSSPVILAYPGAMQSSVLGLSDMLSFAGLSPTLVAQEAEKADSAGAIILPPAAHQPDPGTAPWIPEWLRSCARDGVLVCSACVGVTWIAAAQLDAGRAVTTHWGIGSEIRKQWPDLNVDTDRLVIEYTDLVTAGGLMAWIDLALIVIERLSGHDAMLATARHFVVDPGRRDQRRFQRFNPITNHGDAMVLRAQQILEKGIQTRLPVPDLAALVGLSPRSLQRRFTDATGLSLTTYMQKQRIEQAKSLLADSNDSVAKISAAVGYGDVPAFHRVFLNHVGITPAGFRKSVRQM
ncbi:GlxA family transcriptional regulator [Tropicimonas marinistellae]|uniref:GlxA family transcriptional regulator n=1 Tax=Tropicimonas marinistellae TaxID=1739787 RepID=UPI00082DFD00|nr:helix-turn-helix domain-containing protein [Tropicimonas marinistellae]